MIVEIIDKDVIQKKKNTYPSLAVMKIAARVKENNNKPRLLLDLEDSAKSNKKIVLDLELYMQHFIHDKCAEYIPKEKIYKDYKDIKPYVGVYKVFSKSNNKLEKCLKNSEFVSPYDDFSYFKKKTFLFYGKWNADQDFIGKLCSLNECNYDFVEKPLYFSTLNLHLLQKDIKLKDYSFCIITNDFTILKEYEGKKYYVDILNGSSTRELIEFSKKQPKVKFTTSCELYNNFVKWANGKRKKEFEEGKNV